METALKKIATIQVSGLFGLYDHSIHFRTDERITIIHGPNGIGKTVILRMIANLFRGRYLFLTRTAFSRFTVSFTDSSEIQVEKTVGQPSTGLAIVYRDNAAKTGKASQWSYDINTAELEPIAARIARESPWISRIGTDTWLDEHTDEQLDTAELIAIAMQADLLPEKFKSGPLQEPDWLRQFRDEYVNVHLVETQRLLRASTEGVERHYLGRRAGPAYVSTVKSYASALKKRIGEDLSTYAERSQSLDRTFPQRMLAAKATPLAVADLKKRMTDLENKRAELKRIGLLDGDIASSFNPNTLDNLDNIQRDVMTLYVEDTARKLGALDQLDKRIVLLLDNINRKFKHKQIAVNRADGIVAYDSKNNQPLDLDSLSSGEQHEIVLTYDLLFRVKPNSLVLIDEPELSLHVVWQKAFLPDLMEIVKTAGFDVLLATHSPFIVGERTDLMVALGDENEDDAPAKMVRTSIPD